jgi:hypothetical protein
VTLKLLERSPVLQKVTLQNLSYELEFLEFIEDQGLKGILEKFGVLLILVDEHGRRTVGGEIEEESDDQDMIPISRESSSASLDGENNQCKFCLEFAHLKAKY